MPVAIPPGMTDPQQILALLRKNGMTQDSQVTYPQPSGGTVTMPSILPAQDGTAPGPIQQAVTAGAPVAPKGPTIYQPAAPGPVTNDAQPFNMDSYLSSKFGASAPQVRSITPINNAARGDGGAAQAALAGMFATAQGKANQANESRFQAARKELAGFGAGYKNDINTQFKQDTGNAEQQAVSRGLGNSTIRNSLLGGAIRRKNDALLNLGDRLASARVNLLQSKNDIAPDAGQAAQLFQLANQGAYGSGNTLASIAAALGLK